MQKPEIPKEIAPDLVDRLRSRFGDFPVIQGWGLEIMAMTPGQATVSVQATPRTTNPNGITNGGILASLADMASALALSTAFDGVMPFATSDLSIRYLEPAQGPVEAEATVIRISNRSAIISCELRAQGEIVALCTSHFAIKLKPQA